MNDMMQKHFDLDMKIRDVLTTANLQVKTILANRLQGILDGIDSEMKAQAPAE